MMHLDGGGTSLTRPCAVMVWFLRELTDAVMYNAQWIGLSELGTEETIHSAKKKNISIKPSDRIEADDAYDRMLDPIAGSTATRKTVARMNNLFLDYLFGTDGTEVEQRVLATLRKDFQVGSEDWNDVHSQDKEFVG